MIGSSSRQKRQIQDQTPAEEYFATLLTTEDWMRSKCRPCGLSLMKSSIKKCSHIISTILIDQTISVGQARSWSLNHTGLHLARSSLISFSRQTVQLRLKVSAIDGHQMLHMHDVRSQHDGTFSIPSCLAFKVL
ncbi:hypothetical protein MRB53_038849 [Persea americana]|nr:hypothetical protein MRB53_038849 [Persea americana]